MDSKKGDEHLHHPVCELCQKEFDDVHELSKHVNEEHRNQAQSGIRIKIVTRKTEPYLLSSLLLEYCDKSMQRTS
jgi:uncharacterized C2H2 Zn-finger protein